MSLRQIVIPAHAAAANEHGNEHVSLFVRTHHAKRRTRSLAYFVNRARQIYIGVESHTQEMQPIFQVEKRRRTWWCMPNGRKYRGENLLFARKIAIASDCFLLHHANDPRQCVKLGNRNANRPLHCLFGWLSNAFVLLCVWTTAADRFLLLISFLPDSPVVIGNQNRKKSHKNWPWIQSTNWNSLLSEIIFTQQFHFWLSQITHQRISHSNYFTIERRMWTASRNGFLNIDANFRQIHNSQKVLRCEKNVLKLSDGFMTLKGFSLFFFFFVFFFFNVDGIQVESKNFHERSSKLEFWFLRQQLQNDETVITDLNQNTIWNE